jgi:acetylornithine deacetylase/succinyl-diaminopimelate desuccinylase-like protein
VTDYGVLFREVAIPRLVGSANHTKVREILARELAARGFSVEEHAFRGRPARALLGAPRFVDGINLIARRPSGRPIVRPSVWLAAHYDSKGQPISMAVRLLGFGAVLLGLIGLLAVPMAAAPVLALGGAIVLLNRVNDNSAGAIDNATALVAIFMTLDQPDPAADVGVVFPDAEEFGLAGARALVAERADVLAGTAVINLDGLDDVGRPTVLVHRPGRLGTAVAAAHKPSADPASAIIAQGISSAVATAGADPPSAARKAKSLALDARSAIDRLARLAVASSASAATMSISIASALRRAP